ncbi:hypothetical protein SELMODRAFT_438902 [Selaginella moellendorffii]|uniref:Uncharacterized protein n=1 Tax=Selaginella moellendorffii TaxID=88036 RepID=D8R0C4_SELML|nr:hypothetical protein SELMODRAFT_438902 [Selaginella moellendorffii]
MEKHSNIMASTFTELFNELSKLFIRKFWNLAFITSVPTSTDGKSQCGPRSGLGCGKGIAIDLEILDRSVLVLLQGGWSCGVGIVGGVPGSGGIGTGSGMGSFDPGGIGGVWGGGVGIGAPGGGIGGVEGVGKGGGFPGGVMGGVFGGMMGGALVEATVTPLNTPLSINSGGLDRGVISGCAGPEGNSCGTWGIGDSPGMESGGSSVGMEGISPGGVKSGGGTSRGGVTMPGASGVPGISAGEMVGEISGWIDGGNVGVGGGRFGSGMLGSGDAKNTCWTREKPENRIGFEENNVNADLELKLLVAATPQL